eukprot:scaffold679_cov374-Prasinococcus_capsulatus_cf.AAC.8
MLMVACSGTCDEDDFFTDPRVERRFIKWLNSAKTKGLTVRMRAELKRRVIDVFHKLHQARLKMELQENRARNEPEYRVRPASAEDAEALLKAYRSDGLDNNFNANAFIVLLAVRASTSAGVDGKPLIVTMMSTAVFPQPSERNRPCEQESSEAYQPPQWSRLQRRRCGQDCRGAPVGPAHVPALSYGESWVRNQ